MKRLIFKLESNNKAFGTPNFLAPITFLWTLYSDMAISPSIQTVFSSSQHTRMTSDGGWICILIHPHPSRGAPSSFLPAACTAGACWCDQPSISRARSLSLAVKHRLAHSSSLISCGSQVCTRPAAVQLSFRAVVVLVASWRGGGARSSQASSRQSKGQRQ